MQVVAPKLDHGMVGKFEVSEGRGWIFKGAGGKSWVGRAWEGWKCWVGAKTRICERKNNHLIFTTFLNQNQEMDKIHCNIDNGEIHWIIIAINLVFAKPPGFTGTDCQEHLPKLFAFGSKSLNVFMAAICWSEPCIDGPPEQLFFFMLFLVQNSELHSVGKYSHQKSTWGNSWNITSTSSPSSYWFILCKNGTRRASFLDFGFVEYVISKLHGAQRDVPL